MPAVSVDIRAAITDQGALGAEIHAADAGISEVAFSSSPAPCRQHSGSSALDGTRCATYLERNTGARRFASMGESLAAEPRDANPGRNV